MTARCASATNLVAPGTASVIPPRMTLAAMSDRHLRAETTSRMLPTSVHGPRSARAQGTDAEFGLSMRGGAGWVVLDLSLIHISEPTRLGMISYAVFCLKKKNNNV